jgi:hypothetical protein
MFLCSVCDGKLINKKEHIMLKGIPLPVNLLTTVVIIVKNYLSKMK